MHADSKGSREWCHKDQAQDQRTNGHLQVQVPTKRGGYGANYLLTQVCNVSELEKPRTQVCEWVSKVKMKKGPLRSLQPITDLLTSINNWNNCEPSNQKPSQMSELSAVPEGCSRKNMYLRSEIQCLGIIRFLPIFIQRDKDRYYVTWDSALHRKLHLSTTPTL